MDYWFKNKRRKSTDKKAQVTKPIPKEPSQPAFKKCKLDHDLQTPEGETEETCAEHLKIIEKEMAKENNRNHMLIKKLDESDILIQEKKSSI